mmetsp:Transcript_169068/g.543344  ORF Transcript_169068/g.543344 Transcript_169068/m.543344 type:complete len:217 (+) Transcript_169068:786-1436(+)
MVSQAIQIEAQQMLFKEVRVPRRGHKHFDVGQVHRGNADRPRPINLGAVFFEPCQEGSNSTTAPRAQEPRWAMPTRQPARLPQVTQPHRKHVRDAFVGADISVLVLHTCQGHREFVAKIADVLPIKALSSSHVPMALQASAHDERLQVGAPRQRADACPIRADGLRCQRLQIFAHGAPWLQRPWRSAQHNTGGGLGTDDPAGAATTTGKAAPRACR